MMLLWAGFAASVLAATSFVLFRAAGWTRFSPITQLGCLFSRDPRLPLTDTAGLALFLALGCTLFPLLYRLLMAALVGGPGWAAGAAIGAVHGVAAAAALPLFARFSACVRAGMMAPPGRFGTAWGRLTPLSVATGHVVYGAVFGAILAAA